MLLVFRSPSAIISVMWLISAKMFINEKPPFRLRKFHSIANLCATLNAATTFIMFIIYGTKFRSEFTRIYCFLININKLQRAPAIRQELQQMNSLKLNNDTNEPQINNSSNKDNLPITIESNGNVHKALSQHNSLSTTSTSVPSLSLMERLRNHRRKQQFSFDEKYDLMMNHENNSHTNRLQHEVTIREDDCNGERNSTKPVLLTESYFDWFKKFIGCH
jgi:hypothetical protein